MYKLFAVAVLYVLCMNAHEVFREVYYDVLNIRQEISMEVWGKRYTYYIRDIFPFFDYPDSRSDTYPVYLDIQRYAADIGMKTGTVLLIYFIREALKLCYLLLPEIFRRAYMFSRFWVWIVFYDLLNYVLYAGQVPWLVEVNMYIVSLLIVTLSERKP